MSQRYSDRTALKDAYGKTLTFQEMAKRVDSIATSLIGQNLGNGSIVGVFQTAAADWICSLLAILRIGATYVPMVCSHRSELLQVLEYGNPR